MKSKKSSKATQQDKNWQKKVEKRTDTEKVKLGHPKGKERFEQALKRIVKGKGAE